MKSFVYLGLVLAVVQFMKINQVEARGSSVAGGWAVNLDLSYKSDKSEQVVSGATTNVSDSKRTYYDLSLGYVTMDSYYLGVLYTTVSYSDGVAVPATSSSGNAIGLTGGYRFTNGALVNLSYLMNGSYAEYKKGTGMQFDFGWGTLVSWNLVIGGKLIYRQLKYTENATISGFESYTNTEMLPYLTLGMLF